MTAMKIITPLRAARLKAGLTMMDVQDGIGLNTGNLSRMERCMLGVSPETAAKLCDFIGRQHIDELKILYPHRYMRNGKKK